jgi:heme/copper-type cytochrome/quinol oxidase subunit 4
MALSFVIFAVLVFPLVARLFFLRAVVSPGDQNRENERRETNKKTQKKEASFCFNVLLTFMMMWVGMTDKSHRSTTLSTYSL